MNKKLLMNSNAIRIAVDRKFLRLMAKFKPLMIKELINPSKEQLDYEALQLAKEVEYGTVVKGLDYYAELRKAKEKYIKKQKDHANDPNAI